MNEHKYQVGDILVKNKGTKRVLTIVKIYPTTQIVVYDNVDQREETWFAADVQTWYYYKHYPVVK
jgi:hypothetical protein